MRFLSCFSGIEAASVAWLPLGWHCVGVAEIEPFPCAVLAHHYPDVPNLGSVTADDFLQRASALRPDVLVGGPPCQDFSVAGLRAGLGGDRGNLSLRWVEIVRAIRPAFAVTENVPGWLSVNGGHAFGAFLAGLVGHDTALVPPRQCGGRWTNAGMVDGPLGRVAWRILDAQYFALAQRRQRVFAVFCPRDGADPAAVLFESSCLRWYSPPRREAGERVADSLTVGANQCSGTRSDFTEVARYLNAHPNRSDGESETFITDDCSPTLRAKANDSHRADSMAYVAHSLRADDFDASEDGTGRGTPLVACGITIHGTDKTARVASMTDLAGALRARTPGGQENSSTTAVLSFDLAQITSATNRTTVKPGQPASTLNGSGDMHVATRAAVRRLTPEECEALQGFPRLYTRIPYGKKGKGSGWSADGPRYRSLGNSMAVPVMAWIGRRIAAQEAEIQRQQVAA